MQAVSHTRHEPRRPVELRDLFQACNPRLQREVDVI